LYILLYVCCASSTGFMLSSLSCLDRNSRASELCVFRTFVVMLRCYYFVPYYIMTKDTAELQVAAQQSSSWVLTSIMSGLLYAFGALVLSHVNRRNTSHTRSAASSSSSVTAIGVLPLITCQLIVNVGVAAVVLLFCGKSCWREVNELFSTAITSGTGFDRRHQTPLLFWVLLYSLLSVLGWVLYGIAVQKAPNPGYAIAVVSLEAVAVTLVSAWLFGAQITWTGLLGVLLATSGVIITSVS